MIESLILGSLLHNEDYTRKVLPFLKGDYFDSLEQKEVFKIIDDYMSSYNGIPTKDALKISIDESKKFNQDQYKSITDTIEQLSYDEANSLEWLVDKTEKFCQNKAIYNAVRRSILVLDEKDKEIDKGGIPKLLQEA